MDNPKSLLFIFVMMLILSQVQMSEARKGIYGRPVWLSSTASKGHSVQLGVFDKNETYPTFWATFIVKGPDGKQYIAKKQVIVSQDSWGFVLFPDDFKPSIQQITPGLYSWKCLVRGKTVFHGEKFGFNPGKGFYVPRTKVK